MENIDKLLWSIEEVGNSGFDELEIEESEIREHDNQLEVVEAFQVVITGEFYNLPEIFDIIRSDGAFVAEHIGINSNRDGGGCLLLLLIPSTNAAGYLTNDEYTAGE